MKSPTPCFGPLMVAVSTVFLAPLAHCPAESGEFDPSSALHFDAPVVVGTYAIDMERIISTQTQLARHEATEYQRKVAEARARAYLADQLHPKGTSTPSKPGKTGGTTTKADKNTAAKTTQAAKAKLPRYVAVDTVKDARSVPGTKKVVMIFDTRSETFVDNNVYDVSDPPAVGATEKFDTYSAKYIGTGVAASQ